MRRIVSKLIVERMMYNLLQIVPILNNPILEGRIRVQYISIYFGLVSYIAVLEIRTDGSAARWATNPRTINCSRSIVSSVTDFSVR